MRPPWPIVPAVIEAEDRRIARVAEALGARPAPVCRLFRSALKKATPHDDGAKFGEGTLAAAGPGQHRDICQLALTLKLCRRSREDGVTPVTFPISYAPLARQRPVKGRIAALAATGHGASALLVAYQIERGKASVFERLLGNRENGVCSVRPSVWLWERGFPSTCTVHSEAVGLMRRTLACSFRAWMVVRITRTGDARRTRDDRVAGVATTPRAILQVIIGFQSLGKLGVDTPIAALVSVSQCGAMNRL